MWKKIKLIDFDTEEIKFKVQGIDHNKQEKYVTRKAIIFRDESA